MEVNQITKNSRKSKTKNSTLIQPQALSKDWIPFTERLARTIATLQEDSLVILSKKHSKEFIQIVCQGSFGTRIETISNYFRDEANQLTEEQNAKLLQLGWNQPTGSQIYGTPECSPDGSPNFFIDYPTPLDFDALAGVAVKTFIEVLNISHPGFLEYECFDGAGNTISLPDLGLQRADAANQKNALPKLLIDTLVEVTGIKDWAFDKEGNLGGITFGRATTNIELLGDTQYVRLYSILLENVTESHQLLARVNELNLKNGYMHIAVNHGVVIAISDIQVSPFINHHLVNALDNFCQTVDVFFDILQAEFADGASFAEPPTHVTH